MAVVVQLLLVDEVMRAGKNMGKKAPDEDAEGIYE